MSISKYRRPQISGHVCIETNRGNLDKADWFRAERSLVLCEETIAKYPDFDQEQAGRLKALIDSRTAK